MSNKVSMLYFVYNEANLLEESLEISAQFCDEILIAEGAVGKNKELSLHSTDGTLDIINKMENKYDNIRFISENCTYEDLNSMRQHLKEECTGDYFIGMAGDTVMMEVSYNNLKEKLASPLNNPDWIRPKTYHFYRDLNHYITDKGRSWNNPGTERIVKNVKSYSYIYSPHNVYDMRREKWPYQDYSYNRADWSGEVFFYHYGHLEIYNKERYYKYLYQFDRDDWDDDPLDHIATYRAIKPNETIRKFQGQHPEIIVKKVSGLEEKGVGKMKKEMDIGMDIEQEIEKMGYREMQKYASRIGVKATGKSEVLRQRIIDELKLRVNIGEDLSQMEIGTYWDEDNDEYVEPDDSDWEEEKFAEVSDIEEEEDLEEEFESLPEKENEDIRYTVRRVYTEILERDPADGDLSGLNNYVRLMQNGTVTNEEDLRKILKNSGEYQNKNK